MTISYSHLGICVANLDRSVYFYSSGLNFQLISTQVVEGDSAMFGFPAPRLTVAYLRHGPLVIELIEYEAPNAPPAGNVRRLNQVGFSHLALEVEDILKARDRIVGHGGSQLHDTPAITEGPGVAYPEGALRCTASLMCSDPDGTRIEILKSAGSFPGQLATRMCWEPSVLDLKD